MVKIDQYDRVFCIVMAFCFDIGCSLFECPAIEKPREAITLRKMGGSTQGYRELVSKNFIFHLYADCGA